MATPVATDAPWKKLAGARRVQAEMRALQRGPLAAAGSSPFISHIAPVGDEVNRWRFRVSHFDEDVPAGQLLNRDLRDLGRKFGQDYLLMEVR